MTSMKHNKFISAYSLCCWQTRYSCAEAIVQVNKRQTVREEQIWILVHVDFIRQLLERSASIYIYNFPIYLVAERTKKARTEKKINYKNCFSSVMPPDQHNKTPRDDIKPWSLLLDGFAEFSCPLAPKFHPYTLNCHTLDRTQKVFVVLVWQRTVLL